MNRHAVVGPVALAAVLLLVPLAMADPELEELPDAELSMFRLQLEVLDPTGPRLPEATLRHQQLLAHDNLMNAELQVLRARNRRLAGPPERSWDIQSAEERIMQALRRRFREEVRDGRAVPARRVVGYQLAWCSGIHAVGLVTVSDIEAGGMPVTHEYDVSLTRRLGEVRRVRPRDPTW